VNRLKNDQPLAAFSPSPGFTIPMGSAMLTIPMKRPAWLAPSLSALDLKQHSTFHFQLTLRANSVGA
jgi:hypothetical protein